MVVDLNVMTATGSCTWCEGRAIQQFADDTALTIIDRRADQIAAHVTHIFIVAAHIITAEESILCMQHTLQRWHSWRRLAQPCSTWQSLSTKVLGPQQKQRCRTAAGRTPGASCTTRCDNFFPYTIRLLSVLTDFDLFFPHNSSRSRSFVPHFCGPICTRTPSQPRRPLPLVLIAPTA